ncbi:hypothetical protein F4804DRAFT_38644 [Jackrogersella minutella]|nr:hypothetical protein F4804DRAFT_38644 [Jackrogersella minutella]
MRAQTLVILVAPVAMAMTPRARSGLPKSLAQNKLLNTLATCETGYVQCEAGCMPPSGVCCNDNTDEYCLDGYYCVPDACCPDGEICSGSSDDDAECSIGETECGDLCMPLDGTCCSDDLHYCPDFGTCTGDGYCCDIGDDDCSGSSLTDFSSFTDDFTSTISHTTTKTKTTTSTSDTTTTTSSSHTTSTSSRSSTSTSSTSTSSNTNTPVTTAPAVTTSVSQQAGGIFTADSRVAAGIAVVAAFLI